MNFAQLLRKLKSGISALLGVTMPAAALADQHGPSHREPYTIHDKVEALRQTIHAPASIFSASKMIAELESLKVTASKEPKELREIMRLIGEVEYKRGNLASAYDWVKKAINTAPLPTDPTQDSTDHYLCAKIASELGKHEESAMQYKIAATLAKNAPAFNASQKLGMMEKYAFELHEAKHFQEALKVNQEVLTAGEALFGKDDKHLATVLTNAAQNSYMLKRFEESKSYLQRCLNICQKHGDIEKQQDMLFQLGVLSFETGKPKDARRYMQERVALVERIHDKTLLAKAKQDLAELEERLAAK